jgi:T3SS negative regulator,GrlR
MHRDGEYAVWFRTLHGEGTGIVFLDNGRITGGDSMFVYGGCYEFDGDRFTATLTTRRYAEGTTTVFGVDEVEARLTGTFKGATAVCSGVAEQAPGVRFEAMLFSQQQADVPEVNRAPARPGAARLLKVPDGRNRSPSISPGWAVRRAD